MRFRPANIRLINRRQNLPRLLLALSSQKETNNNKTTPQIRSGLTGHSISVSDGVIINTVVNKYCDHSPLYRQSVALLRDAGIDISRVILAL